MITKNSSENISEHLLLKQYRHIVDATNIVSKTDPRGVITYANKKFVEISGYSQEELLGRHHNILRNPDTPKSFFKELWQTIESKKIWHGVVTNIHKSGHRYTVDVHIFPLLDANGNIVEYMAIRYDITRLQELNDKVNALYAYDTAQQNIARKKLEMGIVNTLDANTHNVIYQPSDILSGDFYSLYKLDDGSRFLYIIDGQGHGISPALSVFAVSSTINQLIKKIKNLEELRDELFPAIRTFLADEEQLSYTMLMIDKDSTKLSFASGGMYPFLLRSRDEKTVKAKANNLPFMNFFEDVVISEIDIKEYKSILIYSDGFVEDEESAIDGFSPFELIAKPELIDITKEMLKEMKFQDDVTLLYLLI